MGLSCFTSKTLQKSTIKSRYKQRFCQVGVIAKVLWSVWEEGFRSVDKEAAGRAAALSSLRSPIAALRHLEICFLTVPWEDRDVFFWQLCHNVHSDVCEFWGLVCKKIGTPCSSFFMNPKAAKTMHITGNLGFLVSVKPCICNSLDQSPTVESDKETWVGISIGVCTLTYMYTLVYLIPFSR